MTSVYLDELLLFYIEGVDRDVLIVDSSLVIIEPLEFGSAGGCLFIPYFEILLF